MIRSRNKMAITTQSIQLDEHIEMFENNKLMSAFEAFVEFKLQEKDLRIAKLELLVAEAFEEIDALKFILKLDEKSK